MASVRPASLLACLLCKFCHPSIQLSFFAAGFNRLWLPKGFSASMAKEWVDRRRLSIRPWASFVDQRKFSKPRNFGEMCQRVVKNVEIYNSNYTFIFLGLILYCM